MLKVWQASTHAAACSTKHSPIPLQVDPYRLTFFVVQYFFIVVAPCFFSAAIYLIFGSFLELAKFANRWFTPRRILIIFVACDAVTTIIQVRHSAGNGPFWQ